MKSSSQHSEEAKRTTTGTTNTSEEQQTGAQAEQRPVVGLKPSDNDLERELAAELIDEHADCSSDDDDEPQDGDEEAFEVDSMHDEEHDGAGDEIMDADTEMIHHEKSLRRRDMSQQPYSSVMYTTERPVPTASRKKTSSI